MTNSPLDNAIVALNKGGLIAYPTEAMFGLGCDPQNEAAIEKLLQIKNRHKDKGLILIAANIEQLSPYLQTLDTKTQQRILASWPGPTTWLLPAKPQVSSLLKGKHTTIAVRIPAHPLAKQLCEAWGKALVSTSANISNQPPLRSLEKTREIFANNIDYYLEGDIGDRTQASQIRDGQTGKIIRH